MGEKQKLTHAQLKELLEEGNRINNLRASSGRKGKLVNIYEEDHRKPLEEPDEQPLSDSPMDSVMQGLGILTVALIVMSLLVSWLNLAG